MEYLEHHPRCVVVQVCRAHVLVQKDLAPVERPRVRRLVPNGYPEFHPLRDLHRATPVR